MNTLHMILRELQSWIFLRQQRKIMAQYPRVRIFTLILVIFLIPFWQFNIFEHRSEITNEHRIWGMQGNSGQWKFVYFFHYLGIYPVAAAGERMVLLANKESAAEAFRMAEYGIYVGETAEQLSLIPYLLDVWIGGDPRHPSVTPATAFGFTLALLAIWIAFWSVRLEVFGAFFVLLLGSDSFQLYEVYRAENVFSWVRTTGLFAMAAAIPLLLNPNFRLPNKGILYVGYPFIVALFTGLMFGASRHMRPECMMTMPVILVVLMIYKTETWRTKAYLASLFLGSFVLAQSALQWHFRVLGLESHRTVVAAGGASVKNPLNETIFHNFWHPMWIGVGDFDTKYGYLYDDNTAVRFVTPKVGPPGTVFNYDSDVRAYGALREKLLGDIVRDPLWYGEIQFKRLLRVLSEGSPPRIWWGSGGIKMPASNHGSFYVTLIVIAVLLMTRRWKFLVAAFLSLAFGGVAFFVTSAGGTHYYSAIHLFSMAFLLGVLCESGLGLGTGLRKIKFGVRQ